MHKLMASHNASGTPFASVTYTRDGVGSPLTANWTNSVSWTVGYGYDAANRLSRETHSIHGERLWTYDWVGNRLDTGFVYDAQTDELNEGPPGVSRQYSTAGSMINKAGVTHEYNALELLKQVGATTDMYWDPESRRLRLTTAGSAYYFVYDPTASIPALLFEDRPTTDVVYVRDPGGALLGRTGADGVRWYSFDALGSTVAVTDSQGAVTDRYDYGTWGEPHPILVGTTDNSYLYVGQLGYYTHWQDPALADALELGVRFYEPEAARCTQRDAVGASLSVYRYAGNQPAALVDPSGMTVTFSGCNDKQKKQINLHLGDIGKNRIKCLTGGKKLQECVKRRMDDMVVVCDAACDPGDCGETVVGPRKTIHLCPDAFDKSICGCLGSSILHEVAHSCNPSFDPGETPEGFQCEWDCYKKKGCLPCPD